jgi:hypothetical protein
MRRRVALLPVGRGLVVGVMASAAPVFYWASFIQGGEWADLDGRR